MNQRELIINLGLLALILVLAYFLLTLEPETHIVVYTPPVIQKIEEKLSSGAPTNVESSYGPGATDPVGRHLQDYPAFFNQTLFDPLVPTPPPTPIPTPSPTPPADLGQALASWTFQYPDGNKASFMDKQTGASFEMTVGEKKTITWGRYTLDVELKSVDSDNLTATVGFEDQSYTFNF